MSWDVSPRGCSAVFRRSNRGWRLVARRSCVAFFPPIPVSILVVATMAVPVPVPVPVPLPISLPISVSVPLAVSVFLPLSVGVPVTSTVFLAFALTIFVIAYGTITVTALRTIVRQAVATPDVPHWLTTLRPTFAFTTSIVRAAFRVSRIRP